VSDRTRLASSVLAGGLAVGIAGDLLLRETPWGLNWAIWSALVAAAAVAAARLGRFPAPPAWPWLLAVAVLFGAALAWRASPVLAGLNLAAALAAAALAAGVLRAGVVSYVTSGALAGVEIVAGPLPAVADGDWDEVPRHRWSGHAGATLRGLAVAVPLVLLFGALFFAADAVFEGLVRDAFDLGAVWTHLVVVGLWTWVSCGLLHHLLTPREPVSVAVERRFGTVEIGVVLGALDVLFLVFVVVQLRYLFGGDDHVVGTTGLTYAEYARRGFFELVAVAALAVPVVLAADSLARSRRLFRILTVALVALLAVVMASAVERMRLYTEVYGLTQLRLYTLVFMLWLAAVLAWMLVTVLRDRHSWFMPGALVAGFATVAALNVANPDALIARTNLDRHVEDGKRLDVGYLSQLSADATPELVARSDELGDSQARSLLALIELPQARGWRTWNWSRARADDYASRLEAARR
jgi:hypothetical protein